MPIIVWFWLMKCDNLQFFFAVLPKSVMAFICLCDKNSVIDLKTNFIKTYRRCVMWWHED